MELKEAFGRRIKTLRELRGLTQNDLAAALERSVDGVSMIERGKNWPSIPTVERLAEALGVSTTELFDDLNAGDAKGSTDLFAVAKDLMKKLSQRDLEVAVAMLEALAKKSTGRRPRPPA